MHILFRAWIKGLAMLRLSLPWLDLSLGFRMVSHCCACRGLSARSRWCSFCSSKTANRPILTWQMHFHKFNLYFSWKIWEFSAMPGHSLMSYFQEFFKDQSLFSKKIWNKKSFRGASHHPPPKGKRWKSLRRGAGSSKSFIVFPFIVFPFIVLPSIALPFIIFPFFVCPCASVIPLSFLSLSFLSCLAFHWLSFHCLSIWVKSPFHIRSE